MLGLIVATAIAEAFGGDDLVLGVVLTVAAALAFGLLTVQYALFTAAITIYVVVISDTLGEPAFQAVDERATGTVARHPHRLPRLASLAESAAGDGRFWLVSQTCGASDSGVERATARS